MPVFALGLNHRTAPIEVRESVAFDADAQRAALAGIRRASDADEVVLVATCNRSELYLRGADARTLEGARAWLGRHAAGRQPELEPHLYRLRDAEVARHAFRLACGMDSMVVGETQILGQVKQALRIASAAGTLGGTLERMFQRSFAAAKEVRSRTDIGRHSVSLAAAAVQRVREIFGDLSGLRLLLIGAGEMIDNAAVHFAAHRPRAIVVANRTLERGAALAARLRGSAMELKDLPARVHEFDVIVTCTASSLPIVGKGMMERAVRLRQHRPVFIADLAMPRDVEPEVASIPDVFLQTLDMLGRITGGNRGKREEAAARASAIIDRHVTEFGDWVAAREAVPYIRRIRSHADHLRELELACARKSIERGADPLQVLEDMSARLANKLLHPAMQALNGAAPGERARLMRSIRGLYLD